MSKLVKGIKKVFKKAVKFVKRVVKSKVFKWVAMAVAVYFTAGVAMSYFGPTAGFSASMPGFGAGGWMTRAATAIGFNGPAAAAAGSKIAAANAAAAASGIYGPTATGGNIATAGVKGITALEKTAALTKAGSSLAMSGGPTASTGGSFFSKMFKGGTPTTTTEGATTGFFGGMSSAEKLMFAKTAFDFAGGLASDSQDDINRKQHERENQQMYGIGRDGTGVGATGLIENHFGDYLARADSGKEESSTPSSAAPPTETQQTQVEQGSGGQLLANNQPQEAPMEQHQGPAEPQQSSNSEDLFERGLRTGSWSPTQAKGMA